MSLQIECSGLDKLAQLPFISIGEMKEYTWCMCEFFVLSDYSWQITFGLWFLAPDTKKPSRQQIFKSGISKGQLARWSLSTWNSTVWIRKQEIHMSTEALHCFTCFPNDKGALKSQSWSNGKWDQDSFVVPTWTMCFSFPPCIWYF